MNEIKFTSPNSFKIKRPGTLERTHRANLIMYVDHKDGVHIAKNRYGPTGNVNTECLVNILSHILAEQVFDGRTIIFQEGLKKEIEKAINQVIEKGYLNDTF
jgi:hypothetical protein